MNPEIKAIAMMFAAPIVFAVIAGCLIADILFGDEE